MSTTSILRGYYRRARKVPTAAKLSHRLVHAKKTTIPRDLSRGSQAEGISRPEQPLAINHPHRLRGPRPTRLLQRTNHCPRNGIEECCQAAGWLFKPEGEEDKRPKTTPEPLSILNGPRSYTFIEPYSSNHTTLLHHFALLQNCYCYLIIHIKYLYSPHFLTTKI